MITIKRKIGDDFEIHFDKVEIILMRKLANMYFISTEDMIIACINKGMDVIGKPIKQSNEHDKDRPECDDIC